MAIISIKNASLIDTLSVEGEELSPNQGEFSAILVDSEVENINLTNNEIRQLEGFSSYYYANNNLIVQLLPSGEETEIGRFRTDRDGKVEPECVTLWKTKTGSTFSRDDYISAQDRRGGGLIATEVKADEVFRNLTVSDDRRRLEFRINVMTFNNISLLYDTLGLEIPEFGLIGMTFKMKDADGRNFTQTIYFKYTYNPIYTTPPLPAPPEPLEEVVFISNPYTFETLFIPTLSASFVYNFFEPDEISFESSITKTLQGFPISEMPRYVELRWGRTPILDPRWYEYLEGLVIDNPSVFITPEAFDGDEAPPEEPSGPPPTTPSEDDIRTSTGRSFSGGGFLGGMFLGGGPGAAQALEGVIQESDEASSDSAHTFDAPLLGRDLESSGEDVIGGGIQEDLLDPVAEQIAEASALTPPQEHFLTEETLENLGDAFDAYNAATGYIGYIIIKERVDTETGEVRPIDIFVITNPSQTVYFDFQVAYGETYRYRIRSVFKYINKDNRNLLADTDATFKRSGSAVVFDRGVLFPKAHYYDSEFSNLVEIDTVEFVKPDPPRIELVEPNSENKEILLFWTQKQQNKDVLGYNVYRRESPDSPFIKLNDDILEKRNNYYSDKSIIQDKNYIYAVESVDVHSNFSDLSAQYKARIITQDTELGRRCEEQAKLVAYEGLELSERSAFPEEKSIKKVTKSFKMIVNPLFVNLDENFSYLLKVRSLDTCEEKEIKIKFRTQIINTEETRFDRLVKDARKRIEDYERAKEQRLRIEGSAIAGTGAQAALGDIDLGLGE